MKKNLIILLSIVILFFKPLTLLGQETENIEQYHITDEIIYKFIKSQNKYISNYKMKEIVKAIKYYIPRYFGDEGIYNEGLIWTLSIMARESVFRNINGDEGKSIGYMQIQNPTCNIARKYNGIKRQMNLIALWDNIHCGMGELNRLHEKLNCDWDLTIKGYNGGLSSVLYPNKWRKSNRQTDIYLKLVKEKRDKLLEIIEENE